MNDELEQAIEALVDKGYSYYDILHAMARICNNDAFEALAGTLDADLLMQEAGILSDASDRIEEIWTT